MSSDIKIAHLGFIQNIINRMASNSFLIKGFSITFVTTLYSYLLDKNHIQIIFIPICLFWYLDAYFLYQEKLYRELYNKVVKNESSINEFSLDASIRANEGECSCDVLIKRVKCYFKAFLNPTILCFNGAIPILFTVIMFRNL